MLGLDLNSIMLSVPPQVTCLGSLRHGRHAVVEFRRLGLDLAAQPGPGDEGAETTLLEQRFDVLPV